VKTLLLLAVLTLIAVFFRVDLFNYLRPLFLTSFSQLCKEELVKTGASFEHLGDLKVGSCVVNDAVRISGFGSTQLSSSITVTCPFGLKLDRFFSSIGAAKIRHMGAYNCRTQRGSGLISEHSYGTAIDISDIDSANVLRDWNAPNAEGDILRKAHSVACSLFSNVLTPDTDRAHANHFHVDDGIGIRCLL